MFKKNLNNMKKNLWLSCVLGIAAGALLIFFAEKSMLFICMTFGIICTVYGLVRLIAWFAKTHSYSSGDLVGGIIGLAAGSLLMVHPKFIISIIPLIIGIVITIVGINKIKDTMDIKNSGYARWGTLIVPALLVLGLGVFIVFNPFDATKLTVQVIGATLVFNGISDLWTISRVNHTIKTVHNYQTEIETTGEEKRY